MIEHVWTVVCTNSVIDKETNNFSLIEVLEQLTIQGPPLPEGRTKVIPISFDVVTLWTRVPANESIRGSARLLLIDPRGRTVTQQEYNVDLTIYQRSRMRTRMAGFPIQEGGCYKFRVQLRHDGESEWKDVANVPLQILFESVQ